MPASWNSYSKSEAARSPRSTAIAPCSATKSINRPEKPSTRTPGTSPSTSRVIVTRSSMLKKARLLRDSATATMTWSNRRTARRTRSSWPRVMGSKVPG